MGGRRQRTTLAAFIQALEGSQIVIELRRDTIVRGTLISADAELNLQLKDATLKLLDGTQRTAAELYIRGSAVRFIHLPGNLDPASAVRAHRRRVAQALQTRAAGQASLQPLAKGAQFDG